LNIPQFPPVENSPFRRLKNPQAQKDCRHAPAQQASAWNVPGQSRHYFVSLISYPSGDRQDPSTGKIFDIEPEAKPSRDFRITGAHRIGQGSLQEKARDNIAAIRLLKTLEADDRDATYDERSALARYVGWGAMPNVFGYVPPGEWRSTAAAVKELLTGPEFESARASTPNAHYTSPQVIEAIWYGLHRMGLGKGAQILEPSMGVGHFFGLMPESAKINTSTPAVW
jgi:hypothetical protein